MFIHDPQGDSYCVRLSYKINKMETFIQVSVTEKLHSKVLKAEDCDVAYSSSNVCLFLAI